MDPVTLGAIITAGAPIVTGLFKKIFKTGELDNAKTVHQILPLCVGLIASIINNYATNGDWKTAILTGLAGGAGASYIRDFDKNVLGLANGLIKIFFKK